MAKDDAKKKSGSKAKEEQLDPVYDIEKGFSKTAKKNYDKETLNAVASLTKSTSDLEAKIYGISPKVGNEIDYKFFRINNTIEDILYNDSRENKVSVTNKLLTAGKADAETQGLAIDIENKINGDTEENMQMLSSITMQNMAKASLYKDYDLICKIFPEMDKAIEITRDAIVSADNISKETFHINYTTTKISEATKHRVLQLRNDYKLDKKISAWVYEALKYGEHHVFINSYSDEMTKMISKAEIASGNLSESIMVDPKDNQTYKVYKSTKKGDRDSLDIFVNQSNNGISLRKRNMELTPNTKAIAECCKIHNGNILNENGQLIDGLPKNINLNLSESEIMGLMDNLIEVRYYDQDFLNSYSEITNLRENQMSDNIIRGAFDISGASNSVKNLLNEADVLSSDVTPESKLLKSNPFAQVRKDRLRNRIKRNTSEDKNKVNVPGTVIRNLDNLRLYTLYAGDIEVGAWYIETDNILGTNIYDTLMTAMNVGGNINDTSRGVVSTFGANGGMTLDSNVLNQSLINRADRFRTNNDYIMMSLAKLAVKKLNKKYLETNPDMVEFIYNLCKTHDIINRKVGLKITFIPPEQLISFKVNEDKYNKGVSIIAKSLFAAKLYVIMLVSNFLTNTVRKHDMRAYYIKQGLNKNITQTIMNAAYQLKKTQFNIHDVMDINRTFNMIGKNHEIFIPVSENGDKPIDFDVIAGDSSTGMENEFLEFLKKAALNGLGMPPSLIDDVANIDSVKPFVMQNERFARSCIPLQIELQEPLNKFFNTLCKIEMGDDFIYDSVLCKFPTPTSVNKSNLLEKLQNNQSIIEAQLKAYLGDAFMNTEQGPAIYDLMYKRLMADAMPELMDSAKLKGYKEEASMSLTNAKETPTEGEEGSIDSDVNMAAMDDDDFSMDY